MGGLKFDKTCTVVRVLMNSDTMKMTSVLRPSSDANQEFYFVPKLWYNLMHCLYRKSSVKPHLTVLLPQNFSGYDLTVLRHPVALSEAQPRGLMGSIGFVIFFGGFKLTTK